MCQPGKKSCGAGVVTADQMSTNHFLLLEIPYQPQSPAKPSARLPLGSSGACLSSPLHVSEEEESIMCIIVRDRLNGNSSLRTNNVKVPRGGGAGQ